MEPMTKTTAAAAFGVLLLGTPAPGFSQELGLRDGDRVVFYGDSITEDGRYARAVEEYVATRFPEWTVSFHNAGVGGDTVAGGWAGTAAERLERDVIAHRPTVVTVMLGMNDGGYKPFDPALFDVYREGYRRIVSRLKEALPGVRLVLLQPSAYDDVSRAPSFPEGYNSVLTRYGAFVAGLALEQGAATVDLNAPLVAGIERLNRTNPLLARQVVPDRVHPGAAGHLVMAGALLRHWGVPATVTWVGIDAKGSRLLRSDGTEVTGFAAKGPYLEWTQADRALPLPVSFADADVELAELAGAGLEALDQQKLEVSGLSAGRYEVLIDGGVVGRFSEAELAAGVNLALRETPMQRQARPVAWSAGDRHGLELARRRLLVSAKDDPRLAEAAAALEALDARMQRERTEAARPGPRRYEVRRPVTMR